MYKRRDYQLLHANDRDDASASSSSSGSYADRNEGDEESLQSADDGNEGESPLEDATVEDSDADEDAGAGADRGRKTSVDGVRPRDSSEGSDLEHGSDEDESIERRERGTDAETSNPWAEAVEDTDRIRTELDDEELVVQVGKVFKCRLCPKVLCLNEATMSAHLQSKKHARYLKQLAGGSARLLIDSDGEDLTEEAETHAERHARIVEAAAVKVAASETAEKEQPSEKKRRKNSGRQRQRKRLKLQDPSKPGDVDKAKPGAKGSSKKPDRGTKSGTEKEKVNRKERRKLLSKSAPSSLPATD